jgi:hypothetical protein
MSIEESLKARRRICITMTVLILLTIACYLLLPRVMAAPILNNFIEPRPAITELVTIAGEGTLDKVETAFADVSALSRTDMVVAVSNVCKTIATIIVVFNFALKLIQVVTRDSMVQDVWIRILMQYVLIAIICVYCDRIIVIFDNLGSLLYTSIKAKLSITSIASDESEITSTVDSLLTSIGEDASYLQLVITATILKFFFWVAGICISIQCYSIGIELAVRKAFLPLAVADMSGEGERSGGFRYLKQYAATWLRMAAVVLMCSLLSSLVAQITVTTGDHVLSFFFKQLVVAFTAVGMTAKLNEIANGALGS